MVPLLRAQSLLSSGVSTGKCGISQTALQPAKYCSSCAGGAIAICTSFTSYRELQESLSMMPRPRRDQLSFTILFSILHSPFLQSSSHLSSYQHIMNRFLYPRDFSKYAITFLPCNPKIREDAATYLGLLVARVLPPFHRQAVCRIRRSVLDLSSSLLLKISVLCSSPSSSIPLGHQDTSIHDITH